MLDYVAMEHSISHSWMNYVEQIVNPHNFHSLPKRALTSCLSAEPSRSWKKWPRKSVSTSTNLIMKTQFQLIKSFLSETESKIKTKIIAVDFTSGPEIYETIAKKTAGLDIGVLINNVAMCYANSERFLQLPNQEKFITDLVTCNIFSVTRMCSLFLPGMVQRRKGVIINVSSLSSVMPSPMLTVYAATKAFVTKFSDDLATENSKHGVLIQAVLPGPVDTNMSIMPSDSMSMSCSPKTFVDSALATLGIARQTTGYFPHTLLQLVMDTVDFISPSGARMFMLKTMEHVRAIDYKGTK